MTVKELIEHLQKLDPDKDVCAHDQEYDCDYPITKIYEEQYRRWYVLD